MLCTLNEFKIFIFYATAVLQILSTRFNAMVRQGWGWKFPIHSTAGNRVTPAISIMFSILAYHMVKYPLKCATAGTEVAHFSGYLNNQ